MSKADDLVKNLPTDPLMSIEFVRQAFWSYDNMRNKDTYTRSNLEEALDFKSLSEAILESSNLLFLSQKIQPNLENFKEGYNNVVSYFVFLGKYIDSDILSKRASSGKSKYLSVFNKPFKYELSDEDFQLAQHMINELRDLIACSNLFEDSHKRRLLDRLEKLQAQLNKEMSDLDHFWGLIGDAGVAVGKFGKDAKPFVDRIRELVNVTWRTQANSEKIPASSSPILISSEASEALE